MTTNEYKSFDSYLERMIRAKNVLTAWKMRGSHVGYSSEIQTTCAFVSAVIHDDLVNAISSGVTDEGTFVGSTHLETALPSLYATAIISFHELVRHYVRKASGVISRNSEKVSSIDTSSLLEHLGLPSWISGVRHDWAHAHFPSLTVLRRCSDIGLNFLKVNVWGPLLRDGRIDLKMETMISDIIIPSDNESVQMSAKTAFRQSLYADGNKMMILKFVVSALLKLTEWDSKCTPSDEDIIKEIDGQEKQAGSFIIKVIAKGDLLHVFCHNLLSYFEDEDEQMREASIAWFIEVMRGMTSTDAVMSDFLFRKTHRIQRQIHLRILWTRVLDHLQRKPSRISQLLLKYFVIILPSLKDTIEENIEIMSCVIETDATKEDSDISNTSGKRKTAATKGNDNRKKSRVEWTVKTLEDVTQGTVVSNN